MLVPAYHHGVEVGALAAAGAVPRFVRVDGRMRLDLDDAERRIGPRTRALYVIHYAGFAAADGRRARARAARRGLPRRRGLRALAARRGGDAAARVDRRTSASSASTRRCRCRTAARWS